MQIAPLYWSRKGEVACEAHAPDAATDRWRAEGWRAIRPNEARRGRYQCQHCSRRPLRSHHDASHFDGVVRALRHLVAASHSPLSVVRQDIARMHVPALAVDDGGSYIAANDAACVLTGFSLHELLRSSIADLTPPEQLEVEQRLWNAFVRTDHQRGAYVLKCKDGTNVRVHYDAYTNIAPGVHVSFLTTRSSRENGEWGG